MGMSDSFSSSLSGLPAEVRKVLGAFYTPEWVVDYMVGLLRSDVLLGKLLEPSGGDGAFVNGLLKRGVDASQVDVWDINPGVQVPLGALGVRVEIGDSLARLDVSARFDGVLGNPPYLNKQSDYVKANRGWLVKRFGLVGASETYVMFMFLCAQFLKPGGQLVFLVSDTFLTLGIHRRFREWLLKNMSIDTLVLLPSSTFTDAAVNTAIISFTNTKPSEGHMVSVVDGRSKSTEEVPLLKPAKVSQKYFSSVPGSVFTFDVESMKTLSAIVGLPKLVDFLSGGLGMYTSDNNRFLAVVSDGGVLRAPVRPGQEVIEASDVDGVSWKFYHKRGGANSWFMPAEHAVRWDKKSREAYTVPSQVDLGKGNLLPRVAISGVSARLAAREATPGALWESNKVFVYAPTDPSRYPASFFVAVLNSDRYRAIAKALNHTVSLQVRDVRELPMLPFTDVEVSELAILGDDLISKVRDSGADAVLSDGEFAVNLIVEEAFSRLLVK